MKLYVYSYFFMPKSLSFKFVNYEDKNSQSNWGTRLNQTRLTKLIT